MTKLTITITRAGLERFTAAQLDDDLDLSIASVGLSDADIVISPTLEALPGEFRRIDGISGAQVGDNIVHMTIRDEAEIGYTARAFGLFLPDGTLFAVYAQSELLFEKSPRATFLAAIDIAFPTGDVRELRFGNTDFINPPATTERKGVIELATLEEALLGADLPLVASIGIMRRVIKASVDALSSAIGIALDGLAARTVYGAGLVTGGGRNDTNRTLTVAAATTAEARARTAPNVAMTPKALGDAGYLYVVEANAGLRILSDGTVEQWGTGNVPANEGAFPLVFPRPFPNECIGVFTTVINNAGSTNGQTTIQESSLQADRANLFVQNHQATNNDAAGFRWRAWGR